MHAGSPVGAKRRKDRAIRVWGARLAATSLCGVACAGGSVAVATGRVKINLIRIGAEEVRTAGFEPLLGWGAGRDHSFVHCLEVVLDALGRPVPYEELMGLSGMAFRIQCPQAALTAAAPDPLVGCECVGSLMAAIGVAHDVHFVPADDAAAADALRRRVNQLLEQGLPALACNVIPPADWGIITGYTAGGRAWWCRAFADGARDRDVPVREWPAAVVTISAMRPVADLTPAYRQSLRRAVELFDTATCRDYAAGRAAYLQWCERLSRAVDREYVQPNAWMYVSLLDARLAAAAYLRRIAPRLGAARQTLEAAAAQYDTQVKLLAENIHCAPFPADVPDGLPATAVRRRQIEVLRQALAIESRAVDLLRGVR